MARNAFNRNNSMSTEKPHQQGRVKKTRRSKLPAVALRALAEAEERRLGKENDGQITKSTSVREINGRKGLDPTRYGDWEKKGIAVDF